MNLKTISKILFILGGVLMLFGCKSNLLNTTAVTISKMGNMISGSWQAQVKFPDWKGYVDDTLAMNSMYSFDGVKDQGKLFFIIPESITSFDLFVNNIKVDTKNMLNGIYEVDIAKIAKTGLNTIQVCNISSDN